MPPGKEECLESRDFCWNESISGLVHTYGLREEGSASLPLGPSIYVFAFVFFAQLTTASKDEMTLNTPKSKHETENKQQRKNIFLLKS